MPNTRDWQPGNLVQCLVYSPPKYGKTWGALTFPRPNMIDFDGGIATARNPEFVKKYGIKSIEYIQPKERGLNAKGVPTSHNAFDDACKYFDEWMRPGKRDQFDTWIVDSGTSLAQAAMNKGIILLGTRGFAAASKTHEQALNTGIVFPKLQDYGSERSMVEQFIRMLKDSGKNFVFICHEKEVTDSEGHVMQYVPLITGKGVAAVGAMFDEIYNIRITGSGTTMKRELITQPIMLRMAGSRYGVPTGIPFDYESLSGALAGIRAQQAMLSKTPAKESPLAGVPSTTIVSAQ